jgi:murein DD-endopeptidase MepM/ murein hydrolase activator NlpD
MNLRLYYPLRPFIVNQHFGENRPCVKDFGLPTQQVINSNPDGTCPIGSDKLYQHFGMGGHNGTDLAAGIQSIYAACDGVVVEKQEVPARGLGLGILTNEQYDFGRYGTHYIKIRYWHLQSFNCDVGDEIKAGQLIGTSDNTGFSSANHLHFEGQLMDKDAGGHPVLFTPLGSISGAIDIEPYLVPIYADTIEQLVTLNTVLVDVLTKLLNLLKK